MIGMLYFVLFVICSLRTGYCLPRFTGDSLLVLVVLIAKGDGFSGNAAAAHRRRQPRLLARYIQGRWLGNTRIVQNWLSHLPSHYHQRAHHLFHKHGLSALLIGRFIAFVRTLPPSPGFPAITPFSVFNWMSACCGAHPDLALSAG